MKKILPYIFMLLIITSFLAPFGVGVTTSGMIIKSRIVSADYCLSASGNTDSPVNASGTCDSGSLQKSTSTSGAAAAIQASNPTLLPTCGLTGFGVGCLAQAIYYILFIPTSYFFALSGQFFDFSFFYSVQDTSYRSPFVVQGWGIVRDFVNMFFIFVLLYVAISTILGVHGFNTKSMIINVVIIGLLINFSLFATQVIIDTSNILARVFYNSSSIRITQGGASGVTDATPGLTVGADGVVPLSAALVNKINPQNLIINGTQSVNKTAIQGSNATVTAANTNTGDLGTGTFILITFMAIAVNVVGIIVFLSTGLMFISRVIGLWLACVFVPFAFFSYTVPAMEGIQLVGWKHWWPDTLKQAFLAPVFIFFLYLILRFLEVGLSLINKSTNGLGFVLGIIVPFVFIMMLLWKAKGIAKDMSGTMGQAITTGLSAAAGLALGGGAAGLALAGRTALGRTSAAASRAASEHAEQAKITGVATKPSAFVKLGYNINEKKKKVGDIDHARHELDEVKKATHLEGINDKRLGGPEQEAMKKAYTKSKAGEVTAEVKRDGALDKNGTPLTGAGALESEEEYKVNNRARVRASVATGGAAGDKEAENKLSDEYNKKLKTVVEIKLASNFQHLLDEAKQTAGVYDRAVARANTSTYDVRKLGSGTNNEPGWKGLLRGGLPIALMGGIAMAVRTGIKTGMNANTGKPTGDIRSDLKEILTGALSSIKIEIPPASGGGGGHDDGHGGGGGHH